MAWSPRVPAFVFPGITSEAVEIRTEARCYSSPVEHRPKGLAPIDPLSVPLPHGTEVTTRVERLAGERRVPQGVVGRVIAIRDDGFDVLITGIGTLRYARDELVPRRPGQVRFAEQRAADWERLRPCVVLEATVGSRAWGLADEGSDTDLRGAFVLPFPRTAGLVDPPHTLTSADGATRSSPPTSSAASGGMRSANSGS